MTLSRMTLGMMGLMYKLRIMTLGIECLFAEVCSLHAYADCHYAECLYAECHCAECHSYAVIVLSVIN